GKYQTTKTKPVPADGRWHDWSLSYDPQALGGRGEMTFVLDGQTYKAPLGQGHRADGATFNRFGLWNQQITGKGMQLRFAGLTLDGAPLRPGAEAGWVGVGNEVKFADRGFRPWQDFGHRKGEVGGLVWRDERPAYYAARVGPLTMEDELRAEGRL